MKHIYTIRAGRITVTTGNTGWHNGAVLMRGNDGCNGFEVQASSVRRCRVLAKRQGIRFPR